MSRDLFSVEKGIHILTENEDTGIMILFGSAAPGGSGDPDAAEQGSVYYRSNGEKYTKTTAGTGTDKWKLDDITNVEDALGLADGDSDMGTYTGSILTDSTTQLALNQELETDLEALQTTVGVAAEAVDMGTYTGAIITDGQTAKQNIQELEIAVEAASFNSKSAAITTEVTLDEINVDLFKGAIWDVVLSLDSDPARVNMFTIAGVHDGIIAPGTPADAANIDDALYAKLKIGATFNQVVLIDINGVGASQTMRLRVSASAAITASARRRSIEA